MRVFIEEQRFKQWWIFGILGLLFSGMFLAFLNDLSNMEKNISLLVGLVIISLVAVLFLILRLHTRIDNYGVTTWFSPLPWSWKHFSWKKIQECYIRRYSAKNEFGGRGLRTLKKKKSYSVAGKIGIQIVTNDGRHLLIGTQKSMDATNVINYYKNKAERE